MTVVRFLIIGNVCLRRVGWHMFEKFYQDDKSHRKQGNSLGFFLVKRIIAIFSRLGKGRTFIVHLLRSVMERIKPLLLQMLFPSMLWTMLMTVLSTVGLVYIFSNGLDTSPVAYVFFVLSAYTLMVLAFTIIGIIKRTKALLYNNKYSNKYMTDTWFRAKTSLYISLVVNLIYAAFQLIAGILYASFWYSAVAVYYIVICGARFLLLYHFRRKDADPKEELKAYRFCGGLLFVLNVATTGMVIQMVHDGQGERYPGLLIYVMAAYAFYRITISVINVVKHRKLHSPVLSAARALNLATALMAILLLETAMFAEFGEKEDLELIMNTATGSAVCLIIFSMALFMIIRANKGLEKLKFYITKT